MCIRDSNKAVALEMFRNGLQFLYRVHDRPDLEKLEAFSAMMKRLGLKFSVSPTMRPIELSRFLKQIQDRPEADFINELMLRSMKKAVYQRHNLGHFGLAFKHYTHFTSPIRRYPDLLVHRLLRARKNGKYLASFARRVDSVIDTVSTHCSETERVAESAEREAIKVKQVQYMARHVGDEFPGVISGVMGFGFFVRLDNLGAEGLVRVSTIDDDYYQYDEKHYTLTGRRTGRIFRLGDPVRVGILSVDKVRNEVSLFLPPPEKTSRKSKPGKAAKPKQPTGKKEKQKPPPVSPPPKKGRRGRRKRQ